MADGLVDIPKAWEDLDLSRWKGVLMVVGEADTGKSTFARYLMGRLAEKNLPVGFIDGDPGQSSLGPPATMSLVVYGPGIAAPARPGTGQDRFCALAGFPPAQICRRSFVGSVSPRGHMLEMLVGADRLTRAAREAGAQTVVYDTCGLIDPSQGGLALKLAKIDLLQPEAVIGIQRENELEPLLIPLQRSKKAEVARLRPSDRVSSRSRPERIDHRAAGFARYFDDAGLLWLDWHQVAIFPLPQFRINGLVGLEDRQGFTLGLGIVVEIDRRRRLLRLVTPLGSLEDVHAVRLGGMTVDPGTFRGTIP